MTLREESGNGALPADGQVAAGQPGLPAAVEPSSDEDAPTPPGPDASMAEQAQPGPDASMAEQAQPGPDADQPDPALPHADEITPAYPGPDADPAEVPVGSGPPSADPAEVPVGSGPPSAGTERRRRSVARALLLGGAAVICVVAIGGLVAAVLLHNRANAHAVAPHLPPVFRLRPGECINSAPNASSPVPAVPCAQPHDAEVFAAFRLAGHSWPGSAAVSARARRGCAGRLGSYLNPQLATATLAQLYIYPSAGAWDMGERTVICEVRSVQGKLTGSVRGLH